MSTTPHDSLFKAVFSRLEHAASVLRAVLPPHIAARIDFRALALRPGSFIDEELAASHADLLFSATFSGHPLLIYILFEHQSTSHPWMPLRLLRYLLRIRDAYRAAHPEARCIPLILPVVLHHSPRGWQGTVAFDDIQDGLGKLACVGVVCPHGQGQRLLRYYPSVVPLPSEYEDAGYQGRSTYRTRSRQPHTA